MSVPPPPKQLPSHYDPTATAQKWYAHWLRQGFFRAQPNAQKEPYTIVMPPPNITGRLHMGHVLNLTLQDVLIRRARMQGKESCWVPGLDHASIATEAKLVAMLREQGIDKKDLTREEFLAHAWQWKDKYTHIITAQLQKLGLSCDWERLRFTMEPNLSSSVQDLFVRLYDQGYIYQGVRMINWDPVARTALSDDEVVYKPLETQLYHIAYSLVDSDQQVVIATTRPETLLGDTAICVHPDDSRYQHLHGKQAWVPMVHRAIPIIPDTYVDPAFGTGCLKVTPAHDGHDYALGQKHNLAVIDIFNEDATLSQAAGHFVGEDRFVAREKMVQQLRAQGRLVHTATHTSHVGFSERTHAIIEPRISRQWFVRMQAWVQPALEHVLSGTIQFHPPKLKNRYRTWLENIQDWCISRQLWWGQRIPAFYLPDGTVVVAQDRAAALAKAQKQYPDLTAADITQDPDVLDTWFSSWLWPISVFDGWQDPHNAAINYFYPTDVLVTAPEIIFFWVARMIMAGYAFRQTYPFKHVYFTGIVRDHLGRKMSKSLGNSPDPIDLIDQYGADATRVGMLFSAPAGQDLLFDSQHCAQGRNFGQKLWHAFRLVQSWSIADNPDEAVDHRLARQWFTARLHQALAEVDAHFESFRISEALLTIYKLIWDAFCAYYLEMVKPAYGQPVARATYEATIHFLATILKMLHPFMPFITEELWHHLAERSASGCILVAPWPQAATYDSQLLWAAQGAFALITQIRNRSTQQPGAHRQERVLYSTQPIPAWLQPWTTYVKKLAHITQITVADTLPAQKIPLDVQGHPFFLSAPHVLDHAQERKHLAQQLAYYEGFLATITKKLNNPRFQQQAPQAVVALEQKKQADVMHKIACLQQQLDHC
ncbi:MAG: valine--tRNA ligase [Bacteroidota bacterium]